MHILDLVEGFLCELGFEYNPCHDNAETSVFTVLHEKEYCRIRHANHEFIIVKVYKNRFREFFCYGNSKVSVCLFPNSLTTYDDDYIDIDLSNPDSFMALKQSLFSPFRHKLIGSRESELIVPSLLHYNQLSQLADPTSS